VVNARVAVERATEANGRLTARRMAMVCVCCAVGEGRRGGGWAEEAQWQEAWLAVKSRDVAQSKGSSIGRARARY
jgi:hypothetical protein